MSPFASRLGRVIGPLVFVAACAFASDAGAQAKEPAAAARELARAGWDALDKQDYKTALEKVTEAEGLYHAPTHLLLMGNAQAGLGRLVDALATFEKLAAEPLTAAAPNAFKEAQEAGRKRMKELLARVPSLLVVVESAEAAGVTVKLDGEKVTFSGGVAVRCNPGEHTIVVEAEGFPPATQKVTLPEKGGVVRVPIALAKPGSPAPTSSVSAGPTASGAPTGTAQVGPTGPQVKPLTIVTLGVAGASLVVGAITGGVTLGAAGDLKKRCPDNHCPNDEQGAYDSANMLATVSTATFVLGGVAAAAGAVLLTLDMLGGRPAPTAARSAGAPRGAAEGVRIQPFLSVGGGGVRGSF